MVTHVVLLQPKSEVPDDEITVPDMLYVVAVGAVSELLLLPHETNPNEATAATIIQTTTHKMPFLISLPPFES